MSEHLDRKTAAELPNAELADHETLLENEHTRITRWTYAPGHQTGWHKHEWDYVTIQQSGGTLLLQGSDSTETRVEYENGRAVAWSAPVEHNAVNVSDGEVRVLEIEYKKTIE